jgi:hypothetical protein
MTVLGAHAGVIKSGRDRVRGRYLPVGILKQVAEAPVKDTGSSDRECRAMVAAGEAFSGSFNPDQPNLGIVQKSGEYSHRIRTTPDAGHHGMRQGAVASQHLFPGFSAND